MLGRKPKLLLLVFPLLAIGCALLDDNAPKKTAPSGLIATPPSYYSTAKARYLGGKYKENLDRMVERIVRNPKTSTLQFANNISSVGGIGFFTHSAAKTADERYLEVVLATPETFESKGELSDKVHRLFSQYGVEILGIISGDSDIYQDRELSGYGLNLAWRNILAEPAGNRVTMARAIIYFPKDRVRHFLRQELNQNDLLGKAVIYSVEEDGPLTLLSYQPQEVRPDFRPAIREDNLASVPAAPQATSGRSLPGPGNEADQKVGSKIEGTQKEPPAPKEVRTSSVIDKPSPPEAKVEPKQQITAEQKNAALPKPKDTGGDVREKPKVMQRGTTEQVMIGELSTAANESKPETNVVTPKLVPPPAREVTPSATVVTPEPQMTIPAVSSTPKGVPSPALEAITPPAVGKPVAPVAEKRLPAVSPAPAARVEETVPSQKSDEMRKAASAPPAPRPAIEKKNEKRNEGEAKQIVETPKPAPAVAAPKFATQAKGPETEPNEKPLEAGVAVGTPQKEEKKSREPPTPVAKVEPLVGPLRPVRESVPSTGKVSETKAREPIKTEAPVKSTEGPRPVEAKAAIPATPIAKAEVKSQEMKAQTSVPKVLPKEGMPDVTPQERAPAQIANENKTADPKAPEKVAPEAPIVTAPIQRPAEKMKAASTTEVAAKVEAPVPAPRIIENVPAQAKSPQADVSAVVAAPAPAAKSTTDPTRPREAPRPDLGPSVAKAPVIEAKPLPPVVTAPPREISAEKPTAEQIALLKKPAEIVPEKRPMARPEPKALEGFIIQLGFNDKEKARRWAEAMERRGYAVSITEAGAEGALRVRLGNFALRDEAERQLRSFKQEGLSGIIINLPQSFRPEARSSIP